MGGEREKSRPEKEGLSARASIALGAGKVIWEEVKAKAGCQKGVLGDVSSVGRRKTTRVTRSLGWWVFFEVQEKKKLGKRK